MNIKLRLVSSLCKVQHEVEPPAYPRQCPITLLRGELFSLQVAYCLLEDMKGNLPTVSIRISSDLPTSIRQVFGVPVRFPRFGESQGAYLSSNTGIYPDLLREIHDSERIHLYPWQWDALWMDLEPVPDTPAGEYSLKAVMLDPSGEVLAEESIQIQLIDVELPRQTLIHTRWLHADSLAMHYHVPVLSVEHNRIMRNYIALAAKRGMNMILTPIHTPPLDTLVGSERMTTQLVDVFKTSLGYSFKFAKLRDFITMCRHEGIRYFEMAHFFTQWGGKHAPKIMGIVDGSYTRLFGWETDALDPEYLAFLEAYIPALKKELAHLDILDRCYFHLTDEPHANDAAHYRKLAQVLAPLLDGCKIIDAMSDADLLQGIDHVIPVPSVDRLDAFRDLPLKERWTYYCLGQHMGVTNTFIAMPAWRTRILGVQLYLERMDGFLHWAFNFYFAQYSTHMIDPYLNTDCDGFGPAGDAFQVYPGEGGVPEESLRLMLFLHAMQDLRALNLLESLSSREQVLALIHEGLSKPITMESYPNDEAWLLSLRYRLNQAIAELSIK